MENISQNDAIAKEIVVNESAKEHLHHTANWSKLFAVLSFIGAGCMTLYSLFILITLFAMPNVLMVAFTLFSAFVTVAYYIVGTYFYRFSHTTLDALIQNDTNLFAFAMKTQRKLYWFMGIFTISSIILAFILAIFTMIWSVNTIGDLQMLSNGLTEGGF